MTMGSYDDVLTILHRFGEQALIDVIQSAEAGWFNGRSWRYWHYKLGLAKPNQVPPMPARRFG